MVVGLDQIMMASISEIQTRSQVEEVLTELVTDVELTVRLQEQLHHHVTVKSLEGRLVQFEDSLIESCAVQKSLREESQRLVDHFLKELWDVSRDLGELNELRGEHQELLGKLDEAVAKIVQTEEDLSELRSRGVRVVEQSSSTPVATETVEEQANEPTATTPITSENAIASPPLVKSTSKEASEPPEISLGAPAEASSGDVPEVKHETEDPTPTKEAPSPPQEEEKHEVVARIDSVDDEDKPPEFADLDHKILMNIFAFLDALEILNTAQTCVSLYSRVDSLFDLGGSGDEEETSTIGTAEVAAAQATIAAIPSQSSANSVGSSSAPTSQPTVTTASTVATTISSAILPAAADVSTGSKQDSTPKRGILGGLFEQANQAATRSLANAKASPARKPVSPPQHQRTGSHDGAPMNASMANSMAAKLSDAELNAIILMTERLRQKEAQAETLKREKEELVAKLDGVEGVKEFLIGKVRSMEVSISQTVEAETKVALQIASDQEVISFLDGRVQELERDNQRLENEKAEVHGQLQEALKQNVRKAAVLGDMVQFEREKQAEMEREFRAKKKVLVREIKTIRSQLSVLQGERDGMEHEIESYRRQRSGRSDRLQLSALET